MTMHVCEVCWTSSFDPCPEDTANAVRDPETNGWMRCGMCFAHEGLVRLDNLVVNAQEIIGRLLYWIERGDDAYLTTERLAKDWLALASRKNSTPRSTP